MQISNELQKELDKFKHIKGLDKDFAALVRKSVSIKGLALILKLTADNELTDLFFGNLPSETKQIIDDFMASDTPVDENLIFNTLEEIDESLLFFSESDLDF